MITKSGNWVGMFPLDPKHSKSLDLNRAEWAVIVKIRIQEVFSLSPRFTFYLSSANMTR